MAKRFLFLAAIVMTMSARASSLIPVDKFFYVDTGPLNGPIFFANNDDNAIAELNADGLYTAEEPGEDSNIRERGSYLEVRLASSKWVKIGKENDTKYKYRVGSVLYEAAGYDLVSSPYVSPGFYSEDPKYGEMNFKP